MAVWIHSDIQNRKSHQHYGGRESCTLTMLSFKIKWILSVGIRVSSKGNHVWTLRTQAASPRSPSWVWPSEWAQGKWVLPAVSVWDCPEVGLACSPCPFPLSSSLAAGRDCWHCAAPSDHGCTKERVEQDRKGLGVCRCQHQRWTACLQLLRKKLLSCLSHGIWSLSCL